jgi:hypothetical protein
MRTRHGVYGKGRRRSSGLAKLSEVLPKYRTSFGFGLAFGSRVLAAFAAMDRPSEQRVHLTDVDGFA